MRDLAGGGGVGGGRAGRALFLVPHMDDEAISCGGAIRHHLRRGDAVCVQPVYCRSHGLGDSETRAEYGSFLRSVAELVKPDLPAIETPVDPIFAKASEPEHVGYAAVLQVVERALSEQRPNFVYGPTSSDLNQDHRKLSEIINIALRPWNAPAGGFRYAQFFGYPPDVGRANLFIEMSESDVRAKNAAMACYQRETRSTPHVRSPEKLRDFCSWCGALAGVPYAEPYALKMLREV